MKQTRQIGSLIGVIALLLALFANGISAEEKSTSGMSSTKGIDEASLRDDGDAPDLLNAPGLSKGVDSIIAEIRKREVNLALREQRVAERERAVVELEELIDKRAIELDRIRTEIEGRISDWSSQGQDRVLQLSNVYSSMPPNKAGKLLGKLDLDLTVSIIRGMKKKSSAGVLAAMSPDRALSVSRRMLKPLDPTTDAPAAKAN